MAGSHGSFGTWALTVLLAAACLSGCATGAPVTAPSQPVPTQATSSPTLPTPAPTTPAPTTPAPTTPATPAPTTRPPTAPAQLPGDLRGRDVTAIPTRDAVVALTFDGGANAQGLPSILATLQAEGVTATFFLTGDFAQRYPAEVQRIRAGGHVIGNHSMTHPHFTVLSADQTAAQLAGAAAAIEAAGGPNPQPWFRFPFGDRDPATIDRVNDLGYVCVGWTVDTLGWQGTSGGRSVDSVVQRVVTAAAPGAIVLMHAGSHPEDGSTLDADALPRIIASLRGLGYGFTTVRALAG